MTPVQKRLELKVNGNIHYVDLVIIFLCMSLGLRVARLRLIFKIPRALEEITFGSGLAPSSCLAYVEWFTKPRNCDINHGMYPITYSQMANGDREVAIIDLDSIVRACQLIPDFGQKVNRSWTSDTVLDDCSHFYISNWKDQLAYQTIY